MWTTLLGFLCLLCVLHNSLACMCSQKPTVQSEYCDRQDRFLIQARVDAYVGPLIPCGTVYDAAYGNSVLYSNGYYRYKLNIEQVYRDIGSLNSSVDVMDTVVADSLCGYEFDVGQNYILSGTQIVDDNGNFVRKSDLCNLHDTDIQNFILPDCGPPSNVPDVPASPQGRNTDPFLSILERLVAERETKK